MQEAQDEERAWEVMGSGKKRIWTRGTFQANLVSWWVPRQRTVQYRAPQLTQVYGEGKPQTAQKGR